MFAQISSGTGQIEVEDIRAALGSEKVNGASALRVQEHFDRSDRRNNSWGIAAVCGAGFEESKNLLEHPTTGTPQSPNHFTRTTVYEIGRPLVVDEKRVPILSEVGGKKVGIQL